MLGLPNFDKTVAEIVRADYRTADVFKKFGINYCCGGKVLLEEACFGKEISYPLVVQEVEKATRTISLSNNLQFDSWKIDFLIDYLVNVHHAYLYNTLPPLQINLLSFTNSHRKQFAYLDELLEEFEDFSTLLLIHNKHEEEVIFPYIKQIENTHRRKETYGNLFVRTLRKPLSTIELEHRKISLAIQQLRKLTDNYQFPENACTNHRVIFQKLKELDNDLVQHQHLENNILFPKAIQLEQDLLQV